MISSSNALNVTNTSQSNILDMLSESQGTADQQKGLVSEAKVIVPDQHSHSKKRKLFIARRVLPSQLKTILTPELQSDTLNVLTVNQSHSVGGLDQNGLQIKGFDSQNNEETTKHKVEIADPIIHQKEESIPGDNSHISKSLSPKKISPTRVDKPSVYQTLGSPGEKGFGFAFTPTAGFGTPAAAATPGLVDTQEAQRTVKNIFSQPKVEWESSVPAGPGAADRSIMTTDLLDLSMIERNIFDKQNTSHLPNLLNEDSGPRQDDKGKIIPRSLVGKPEWYEKNQGSKLTKEDLNMFTSKKHQRFATNQSMSVQSRPNQKSQPQKNLIKASSESLRISKYQLEKQLEEIRQRIKKNIETERKSIAQLQTTDNIRYTQQERTIEKYEQIEKKWMEFIDLSSAKLSRDYASSMLLKSDFYRQKREMTDVFEVAKGPYDMFGSRVWYMNLRESSQQQANEDNPNAKPLGFNQNPLVVLEDVPLAFNHALTQGPIKRQLEIVRKPLLTNLNVSMQKMSSSLSQSTINQSLISNKPFSSFDSIEYYNRRLSDLRADFKYNKKVLIDQQTDVDNLAVIGVSQLQKEEEMLMHSSEDMFNHQLPESEPYVDEIILQNFDKNGTQMEGSLKDFTFPPIQPQKPLKSQDSNSD